MNKTFVALCLLSAVAACGSDGPTGPIQPGDPAAANLGTMAVGDVRILTFTQGAGGLSIPATLSSAQYMIAIGNMNLSSSSTAQYGVHGDWLAPAGSSASGDLLPGRSGSIFSPELNPRGAAFEAQLRASERGELHGRTAGSSGTTAAADRLVPAPAAAVIPPTVGATGTIKVLTPAGFGGTGNCSASGYTTTTGRVMVVGRHSVVVSDVNSPVGGFTAADYQEIANEFDNLIYPTDSSYFGAPTDIDGNGRIIIYYTPAVNKLTPAGEANRTGYVGGFFFAGDLYQPTSSGCLSSNQGEIFYLLAPDPAGVNGNSFATSFVKQVTRGTVAHEFQHMINSGNRYVAGNSVPFEVTWMDEGLAHFAEDAVGRVAAGYGDLQTVTYANINALPDSIASAYFLQNFARAKYYVERPDTTGAVVNQKKASQNLASRGAEWALLRYAADWYSNGNPRAFTRKLVAGPDTGITNLQTAAGARADTVLSHWLITLYTDGRAIANLPANFNYRSYTFRQLITGTLIGTENSGAYLPVTALGNGNTNITTSVPSSSATYFSTTLTNGGARTVTVTTPGGSATSDANGRIYVVRTQ